MSLNCPSCSRLTRSIPPRRLFSTSTRIQSRGWAYSSHRKPSPTIPNPLPAIYPQLVVLSDGSTFTSYTTAPSPAVLRLTRDVTNNPLWAPLKEGTRKEEEGGRMARFRARFGGSSSTTSASTAALSASSSSAAATSTSAAPAPTTKDFGSNDFEWMSEGAVEQKVSAKDMMGAKKPVKKK